MGNIRRFRNASYAPSPCCRTLAKVRQQGDGAYDAFRNRLMFPIRDAQGRVVAFGGRIVDPEDNPKYLNSPEHPLFFKGKLLYGFDVATSKP